MDCPVPVVCYTLYDTISVSGDENRSLNVIDHYKLIQYDIVVEKDVIQYTNILYNVTSTLLKTCVTHVHRAEKTTAIVSTRYRGAAARTRVSRSWRSSSKKGQDTSAWALASLAARIRRKVRWASTWKPYFRTDKPPIQKRWKKVIIL